MAVSESPSSPLQLSHTTGRAAVLFLRSLFKWLRSWWQLLMQKLPLSSSQLAEPIGRPSVLPQLPIRSVRPNLPPPFRPTKLPVKAPMLITAVSAASTEMPLEGLPSNASTESRKVVHRKNTGDGARTMDVLLNAEPQSRRASHRRCSSTITLAGNRPSSFSDVLRQAVLRRESNSVRAMMNNWPKRDEEAEDILIDQTDSEGYNLIHCAVSVRCASILQSLLGALPSDAARRKAVNDYGKSHHHFSPLHLATLRQDYAGASILLSAGADPNAQTEVRRISDTLTSSAQLKTTPLHLAVSKGDVDLAKILLENGANPNAVTRVRSCLMFVACTPITDWQCAPFVGSAQRSYLNGRATFGRRS